jgi:hypothetical protein
MVPIDDEMYETICQNFKIEEEADKESDYRKRIQEKREEEEARFQAVRHEIDEILERSKGTFEPIEVVHGKNFDENLIVRPGKPIRKKGQVASDVKSEELSPIEKIDRQDERKKGQQKEEKAEISKTEVIESEKKDEKESSEKAKRHLKRRPKKERAAEAQRDKET